MTKLMKKAIRDLYIAFTEKQELTESERLYFFSPQDTDLSKAFASLLEGYEDHRLIPVDVMPMDEWVTKRLELHLEIQRNPFKIFEFIGVHKKLEEERFAKFMAQNDGIIPEHILRKLEEDE